MHQKHNKDQIIRSIKAKNLKLLPQKKRVTHRHSVIRKSNNQRSKIPDLQNQTTIEEIRERR